MGNLVYTETPKLYEKPYTTSEVIADFAEVDRDSVMRLIRTHYGDLEEFGEVGFEIRASGRARNKIYYLNESQASLLITYLKNTEPVRRFKKELVKQFFEMRQELMKREIYREVEKNTRKSLSVAINSWKHRKTWSYKHLTDLMCKSITGLNSKKLKIERGVNKETSGIDIYTSKELKEFERLESKIITLLELDMTYEQIKKVVNGHSLDVILSAKI